MGDIVLISIYVSIVSISNSCNDKVGSKWESSYIRINRRKHKMENILNIFDPKRFLVKKFLPEFFC